MDAVVIDGEGITLEDLQSICNGNPIVLGKSVKQKVDAANEVVKKALKGKKPIYGVNTGFGYFANVCIDQKKLLELQENLIKSHAAGHGKSLSISETRLAMALRLNVLAKGLTGVRFALCQKLCDHINAGIYPVIPEYGSLGASGDLAPLAHLALPLIGLGYVHYKGKIISAEKALKAAKISPIRLAPKEGLGLINGTQIMLSVGGLALVQATRLITKADKIVALTYEAMQGSLDSLYPGIHLARGQPGQIVSAANILSELINSYLFKDGKQRIRVQDPYSLRCAPQIHGPCRDAIAYACGVTQIELNAATDNPLVFPNEDLILSGGNFHGEALAIAFDIASIALSELANVSERRLELLLNPNMSGLPAFLSPIKGLHSGYMATQYLSGSLVSENKLLANPASTDSIPGNVGIEDHVSMGMTSARKLKRIVTNIKTGLAIEMLVACQAIDLRGVSKVLGLGTQRTYKLLRSYVPSLIRDRIVADDITRAIDAFDHLEV